MSEVDCLLHEVQVARERDLGLVVAEGNAQQEAR